MRLALLMFFAGALGFGQFRSQGYVVGGITGYSGTAFSRNSVGGFVGGGGHWQVKGSRFGAGGDGRVIWPGFGVGSLDGVVRLAPDATGKVQPFAGGGVSGILGGDGSGKGWNINGGVDYWMRERFGIRFEVRDTMVDYNSFRRGVDHYWTIGIGLVGR